MSYFRPPAVSPLTVWAGRTVALGGIMLAIISAARGIGVPGIGEGLEAIGQAAGFDALTVTNAAQVISPLALGGLGSLAVWRSTEKAAQVRHQTLNYHRGLDDALNNGRSDIALPPEMLDKRGQVSWITSTFAMTMGALIAVAGGFLAFSGLMGGLTSYATMLPNLFGGIAMGGAGYVAWRVGAVASEARNFAYSAEASAERGRVAEDSIVRSAQSQRDIGAPALDLSPAPGPRGPVTTPFTDRFRAEQAELVAAAHAMEQHAARPRSFLDRLRGERSSPPTMQRS